MKFYHLLWGLSSFHCGEYCVFIVGIVEFSLSLIDYYSNSVDMLT